MPRDSNGFYKLPLNPVSDGDIIEAGWANTTMSDLAVQLNNIITRDGLLGPTEPFLISNGTPLLPGLAFNTQANLGFYRDAINAIGIAAGGVPIAKFSDVQVDIFKQLVASDKVILAGEGSASAPTLTVFDDLNTGFYSPAPDVIALATNGVERMRWDASGYVSNTVPIGTLLDFAGSTAPPGYLVCDGSTVSRTTYAALFAVIGTTWGIGDGTTTFTLPDLRRRTTIGAGGTVVSGPGIVLGNVGGEETTTMTWNNMPVHNHGVNDPQHQHLVHVENVTQGANQDHIHYGTTAAAGWHQHKHQAAAHNVIWQGYNDPYNLFGGGTMDDQAYIHLTEGSGEHVHNFNTGGMSQSHAHYFLGDHWSNWGPSNILINNAGGGSAFNNMPPSVVVNKIIRAL